MTDSDGGGPDAEATRIKRLHLATTELHGCSTHEEAYRVVVEAAVDVLGFDWCCLGKADDGMFELVAVSEGAPAEVGERHLAVDEGIAGESYRTGEAVVIDDIPNAERGRPIHESLRSGLSIPLGDWGVFQCFGREPDVFDETDVEATELLLSHATEAFRRIDNETRLREQNERLDQFASVVSHDLRNPLTVARGRLDLYRATGEDEHGEAIDGALDRMERLIEDLLTLAREGADVGDLVPVSIATAATNAWGNVEAGDATLRTETDGSVPADPSRFEQLYENLFRNALEHAGPSVSITVGGTEAGFYVADDGPGIPPADRQAVFEMGFSTKDDGTGFGLAIVDTIAEAHGWEISVWESEAGGARFDVSTGGADPR